MTTAQDTDDTPTGAFDSTRDSTCERDNLSDDDGVVVDTDQIQTSQPQANQATDTPHSRTPTSLPVLDSEPQPQDETKSSNSKDAGTSQQATTNNNENSDGTTSRDTESPTLVQPSLTTPSNDSAATSSSDFSEVPRDVPALGSPDTQSKERIKALEIEVQLLHSQLSGALTLLADNADAFNTRPKPTAARPNAAGPSADIVTQSTVWNLPRTLVSGKKRRFIEDGYNLDLVYVTPKLIGMGLPSQGMEAMYRNPYSQTLAFLDHKHSDKYLVFSLCAEQPFDGTLFHGHWQQYGFDDHTPPPLRLARRICEAARHHLTQEAENVLAVHCKAGKGRTGTVLCMVLLHLGICITAQEALNLFEQKRMETGRALNNPGQVRYTRYYAQALQTGFPSRRRAVLHSVCLSCTPKYSQ